MSALTQNRNTKQRTGNLISYPAVTGKVFYQGGIACIDEEGYVTPGIPGERFAYLIAAGRIEVFVDTNGVNSGDIEVKVRRGCFKYANDGTIQTTSNLRPAYIVDDQTVSAFSADGTRPLAGKILFVDTNGVWVEIQ